MNNEQYEIFQEILDYVSDNEVYYIADLWDYAEKEHPDDWFVELRKGRNGKIYKLLKIYLQSFREDMRRKGKKVPPPKNSWHKEVTP